MTRTGKAIVTGSGGFIGRELAAAMERDGWVVRGLAHADADVAAPGVIERCGEPADVLVHLAFPTSAAFRREHPAEALRQVAAGTAGAIALAGACGARHVVLLSSGKVYGLPSRLPIDEDEPTRPTTYLGELKVLAEAVIRLGTCRAGGFGTTVLRPFNVYGPGAPDGFVVPRILSALADDIPVTLGEIDHRRDWIHVSDVCRAVACVLRTPPAEGTVRVFNVGTGVSHTVRELIRLLEAASGRTLGIVADEGDGRPTEAPDERADWTRLGRLGWAPQVALDSGLRDLWEARR